MKTHLRRCGRLVDGNRSCRLSQFCFGENPGGGFPVVAQARRSPRSQFALSRCYFRGRPILRTKPGESLAIYLDLLFFLHCFRFSAMIRGHCLNAILRFRHHAPARPENFPRANLEIWVLLEPALAQRAKLASHPQGHEVDKPCLGAWGCGVFAMTSEWSLALFPNCLSPCLVFFSTRAFVGSCLCRFRTPFPSSLRIRHLRSLRMGSVDARPAVAVVTCAAAARLCFLPNTGVEADLLVCRAGCVLEDFVSFAHSNCHLPFEAHRARLMTCLPNR